jgi:hypothetical protein
MFDALQPERIFWTKSTSKSFKHAKELENFILTRFAFARVVCISATVCSWPYTTLLPFDCNKIERLEIACQHLIDKTNGVLSRPCPNLTWVSSSCPSSSSAQDLLALIAKHAPKIESVILSIAKSTISLLVPDLALMTRARASTLKRIDLSDTSLLFDEKSTTLVLLALFPELTEPKNGSFVPIRKISQDRFGVDPHIFYVGKLPIWYSWVTFGRRAPAHQVLTTMWTEWLAADSASLNLRSSCIFATATAVTSSFRVLTEATPECSSTLNWLLAQMNTVVLSNLFNPENTKEKHLGQMRSEMASALLLLYFSHGVGDFLHNIPQIVPQIASVLQAIHYAVQDLILEGLELGLDSIISWRAVEFVLLRSTSKSQEKPTFNLLTSDKNQASRFATEYASLVPKLSLKSMPRFLDVGLLCLEHFQAERSAFVAKIAQSLGETPRLNISGAPAPLPWPESVRATKLLMSCDDSAVCALIDLRKIGDIVETQNLLVTNCVRGRLIPRLLSILDSISSGKGLATTDRTVRESLNDACWKVVLRDTARSGGSKLVQNNLEEIVSQLVAGFGSMPPLVDEVLSGSNSDYVLSPELKVIIAEKLHKSSVV